MFFMNIRKRGSEKYYILISLILGLLVLGLSLFFIYNEYFNQDELDWQLCRESIILRNSVHNPSANSWTLYDFNQAFPLKCRTEVVTIDGGGYNDVFGKVSDAVAAAWYLVGEGDYEINPKDLWNHDTLCMAVARIHYTDEAINEFNSLRGNKKITRDDVEYFSKFVDYYKGTKVPGQKISYDKYLPIGFETISVGGSTFDRVPLAVNNVGCDSLFRDCSLKYGLGSNIVFSSALKKILIPFGTYIYPSNDDIIVVYFMHHGSSPELDKSIILVHPDDLNSIGCDEFVTIPA